MLEVFDQFDFIWSTIDIFIIAMIIYNLLVLMRGTRAMQMIISISVIIISVSIFSQFYPLNTIKWLMNKLYPSFIVVLVVLFQEDIRRVLSGIGKRSFFNSNEPVSSKFMLDEITRAASALAVQNIGALIAIERNILLNRYIEAGIILDSRVSSELIQCIFHPSSPIHDGSVVIQEGRISAAGCFLPLSRDDDIDPSFGTRHRAAIGISQETDAVVVAISEEQGAISLVVDGKVSRGLSPKELRKVLRNLLRAESIAQSAKSRKAGKKQKHPFSQFSSLKKMSLFRHSGDQ